MGLNNAQQEHLCRFYRTPILKNKTDRLFFTNCKIVKNYKPNVVVKGHTSSNCWEGLLITARGPDFHTLLSQVLRFGRDLMSLFSMIASPLLNTLTLKSTQKSQLSFQSPTEPEPTFFLFKRFDELLSPFSVSILKLLLLGCCYWIVVTVPINSLSMCLS